MKAMVLAAGVGSRLRPLTDATPKALVGIDGVPMLELVLRRLEDAGATDIIINVHHHAPKVIDYVKGRTGGAKLSVSREEELLLDTGGGLKKAAHFFSDGKPFLVHNVDVLSEVNLRSLYEAHCADEALATIAVKNRPTKRSLSFSADGRLIGRGPGLAFCGIHAVSPALFPKLRETGVFSITDAYCRLAKAGELIRAFDVGDAYWADIGDAQKLEQARRRARG